MKKLLLFILATIVLISCNKKVTLKGRVLNPVTNQGIEGFTIAVSADTWELPGGAKPVGETTSNANGDFVLEFKKSGYDFSVYKEGYYNIGWYQNGEILPGQLPVNDKGKTMHADFYAVPYGFIQLKVNNVNCLDANDHFVLYAEGTQADDSKNGKMIDEYGCYYYDPGGYTKVPMGERYYKYEVTRNSITQTFYDTIFIGEGEYKIYEINY